MNIKDMVENPHCIYRDNVAFWTFLLQSYEGGIDYTNARIFGGNRTQGLWDTLFKLFINGVEQKNQTNSGNLFMHPKERVDDYNRRLGMSYYYNFCAPIIDIYSDHLFKQNVDEDWGNIATTIDQVKEDIDLKGSSIIEFRRELADMAQIYGHVFVVIDSPKISSTEVVTKRDQIEKRAFPYLSIYVPENVINWSVDEFGKPYWVLLREVFDANEDPEKFEKGKTVRWQYRLWTRDVWALFDDKFVLIDQGSHPVGEVPIVCVYDKKSRKARSFLGISSIADISFITRDIFNSCSELRQILRDQTFAFLAIQGSSSEYSELEIGTGKGLLYPMDRNKPEYVSPPSDNANIYFEHIDRQVHKIYQLAKLDSGGLSATVSSSSGKSGAMVDQQSGVSKAWDFNQTNSALTSKSSNLEDGEMRIWQLFAKWEGKEFDGKIQYPDEFSISSLNDDLSQAEQEARVGLGKTFDIEVRKAIQRKKFPRADDTELEKMAQEVESLYSKPAAGSTMAERAAILKQNGTAGNQNQTGGTK
jgi:hypothetical protein